MPNVILLIAMNTGTGTGTAATAEEAIFTDINIFCYLNARSTAATCSQLTISPHFCPKLVTRAIMPSIENQK
jgi:hypothetical protein